MGSKAGTSPNNKHILIRHSPAQPSSAQNFYNLSLIDKIVGRKPTTIPTTPPNQEVTSLVTCTPFSRTVKIRRRFIALTFFEAV